MQRLIPALLFLLAAAGCAPDQPAENGRAAVEDAPRGAAPEDTLPLPPRWASAPAEGVRLTVGEVLRVETGPHAVLWPAGAEPAEPPYTVRARLRKGQGRLHEGYGIVIGGSPLAAPEQEQRYTYFLVRGDGSYLVKRRLGAETPVVRPWTFHPAIRRDTEEGGEPNELAVQVGEEEAVFVVNGAEVARLPVAELDTRGVPGLRVAHDVRLTVSGFQVTPGGPAGASPP